MALAHISQPNAHAANKSASAQGVPMLYIHAPNSPVLVPPHFYGVHRGTILPVTLRKPARP